MKGILNKKTLTLVFLLLLLPLLVGCLPLKNQAPIITSTPITLAEVNELYTYDVNATDPDGDTLTYSLDVMTSGMTINSATGLIEWIPTAEGDYAVVVKVSDGTLDITQSFTIEVIEEEGPGWTPTPPKTHTITASAGLEGSISPSGDVTVKRGSDKLFIITPDTVFYGIDDVLADGISIGAVSLYTFTNVTEDHTISATFKLLGRVYNQTKGTHHDTIQDAIDNAGKHVKVLIGDTILVMAGTYQEEVTIDKNNLTLLGAQANVDPRPSIGGRGGTESIIVSGVTAMDITANNVVINGFTFKSEINNSSLNVVQAVDVNYPQVLYNIVYNTNPAGASNEGIKFRRCGIGGIISYNYVYDIPSLGDAINFDSVDGGIISFNEVRNIGSENAAIYVYSSENITIEGNLVDTTTQNDGIKLGSKGGTDASKSGGLILDNVIRNTIQDGISVYMSDVLVQGNDISNSTSENGAIYLAWAITNITIQGNSVHDNDLSTSKRPTSAGILLGKDNNWAVDATSVTINLNNIYNNTPYGVTNETVDLLDATENWWGSGGDYSEAGKPGVNGNNDVSGKVDYEPWNTNPYLY